MPLSRAHRVPRALLAAAAMAAAAAALAPAAPAVAHAVLIESTPRDGTELDAAPTELRLLFDEPVGEPRVAVVGPGGADLVEGAPVAEGAEVVAELDDTGGAGGYEAAYRVVSDDGHPVEGELTFTVTEAGGAEPTATPPSSPDPTLTPDPTPTPTPTPTASAEPDGESAGVPWTLLSAGGALGVLAVAGVATLRRGGGDGQDAPSTEEDPR